MITLSPCNTVQKILLCMKCPPNLLLVRAHGANFYKDIGTEKQLHATKTTWSLMKDSYTLSHLDYECITDILVIIKG